MIAAAFLITTVFMFSMCFVLLLVSYEVVLSVISKQCKMFHGVTTVVFLIFFATAFLSMGIFSATKAWSSCAC